MNFLAHLRLSGDNEQIMVGNFVADHIRGNKIKRYPSNVIVGIELHRKIDYYTDHHPVFVQSRERLHEKYHKYAGVIMDIFYDHFLAVNWKNYSEIDLHSFVSFCYGVLLKNYTLLPAHTKRILPFIILQNWLVNYSNMQGLQRSFDGMAKRAKFNSNMDKVIFDLKKDYKLYEAEFKLFFPDIIEYTNQEMKVLMLNLKND
jgi:acyl carrier protein phosphodiesterase